MIWSLATDVTRGRDRARERLENMHKQAPSNVRRHLARILLAALLLVGLSAGCQDDAEEKSAETAVQHPWGPMVPTHIVEPTLFIPLTVLPTIEPFVLPTLAVGAKRLHFETVAYGQGYQGKIPSTDERTKVLVAANEEEMRGIRKDATEPTYHEAFQAWDRVDMARDVIVAVTTEVGQIYVGLADIPVEVVDASLTDDTVHIIVRVHKNPKPVMLHPEGARPYHIITLLRSELPSEGDVRFIVDTTEGDRFAEATYHFPSER
jgi:hypothetical protein